MSVRKRRAMMAVSYLLYALTAFGILLIVLYLWPRKIVDLHSFVTTQTEYRAGDTITVRFTSQKFVDARTTSDVFIYCGQGESTVQYYLKTITIDSYADPAPVTVEIPLAIIPNKLYPPECRVVTHQSYDVKYLLGFTRDYDQVFTSNSFKVID